MEIGKIGVNNTKNIDNSKQQKQDYSYIWKEDKDIIDKNVKYAAEQNKKNLAAEISTFKEKLNGATESKDIFNRMGISVEEDENDGKLIISHYSQPSTKLTFKDLDIDEAKLMENVKEIKGDADFTRTSLTNVDNLEKVDGKANISFSKIKSMKNLKEVGGVAQFNNSLIEELPNLKRVGALANLSNTKVKTLPKLETVEGNLYVNHSPIESMPALKKVKGDVDIIETNMKKDDVKAEVGGKIKDKKETFVPPSTDYSYLWDADNEIIEANKKYAEEQNKKKGK